jgi:predicted GNAT family acetyltransferase
MAAAAGEATPKSEPHYTSLDFIGTIRQSVAGTLQRRYMPTHREAIMATEVSDNSARSRYELQADGGIAVAYYEVRGDTLVFTHTIVPEELQGQGLASRLIKGALDDIRRRGLKIVPQCSFVARYIERHPEERDLAVED